MKKTGASYLEHRFRFDRSRTRPFPHCDPLVVLMGVGKTVIRGECLVPRALPHSFLSGRGVG